MQEHYDNSNSTSSIGALITAFLEHCRRERNLAANSIAAYAQDLAEFRRFLKPETEPVAIRPEVLAAYRDHLSLGRRAAPATVKRRLASLRVWCRWLVRISRVEKSPFDGIQLTVQLPKRLPRCLDPEEVSRLLSRGVRGPDSYLAVAMLVTTGIRVGELASLRTSRIDPFRGAVRIIGKGNRERTVYVTDGGLLGQITERIGESDAPLLRGQSGSAMSTAAIRRLVVAAARRGGLRRRVTPHMLRHTAATLLMERGVDVRIVQQLLGHRSILTTQLYLHVSDAMLRSAVANADVLSNLRGRCEP